MAGTSPAMTREGWATGLTELDTPAPRSRGEPLAEHRQAADRLRRGRLVLKNVPMLGEPAVFEAHDVGGDPRRGTTVAGKTAVGDHIIPSGEDDVIFIAQRIRQGANEIEQAIAARRNMGAVLDVSVRPEALCGGVVAFVEQRVEGFENKRLVLCGRCCGHVVLHDEGARAVAIIRREVSQSPPARRRRVHRWYGRGPTAPSRPAPLPSAGPRCAS